MSPYRKHRASNRRTQRENSRMETNVAKVDRILAEERQKRERGERAGHERYGLPYAP